MEEDEAENIDQAAILERLKEIGEHDKFENNIGTRLTFGIEVVMIHFVVFFLLSPNFFSWQVQSPVIQTGSLSLEDSIRGKLKLKDER